MLQYHHTTSNRLFKAPVTVDIRFATFSSFFACSSLPMDWCGHTKALSGYPLQTPSNMVESCYVMLGYVRLNQKMSNAVKHSQTLSNASDSKLLAPFVFRFSDKLINSIQLHSTPLKHHDTNSSIDPVPPASKGGQDSPESPWKKKLGCCDGNCSRLINEFQKS